MINVNEIIFSSANSHETYFTLHNVKMAHNLSLGEGVKVGVIDWLFDYKKDTNLYSGFADISGNLQSSGHGLWMATTLREIAPKCEIYAINAIDYSSEESRVASFEKAIKWAIKNKIEILTYSHPMFTGENKIKAHVAIAKAAKAGIVTTFIHCDSPHNIWPYGCFDFREECFERMPDLNILHFDYSVLISSVYERYSKILASGEKPKSGNDLPFFSFSSMSVVLGGFVALMKACKPSLNTNECRQILIETSYEITQQNEHWYDVNPCKHVVDIAKALKILK